MSRGLSRLQRGIYNLFTGKARARVYGACKSLTTGELVEEVIEAGLLADDIPQKQALATVRRACYSLVRRGLLQGERVADERCRTISWSAVRAP